MGASENTEDPELWRGYVSAKVKAGYSWWSQALGQDLPEFAQRKRSVVMT